MAELLHQPLFRDPSLTSSLSHYFITSSVIFFSVETSQLSCWSSGDIRQVSPFSFPSSLPFAFVSRAPFSRRDTTNVFKVSLRGTFYKGADAWIICESCKGLCEDKSCHYDSDMLASLPSLFCTFILISTAEINIQFFSFWKSIGYKSGLLGCNAQGFSKSLKLKSASGKKSWMIH